MLVSDDNEKQKKVRERKVERSSSMGRKRILALRKIRYRLEINNERRDFFFFMYNSPDNVYSDDLTTPKRTK